MARKIWFLFLMLVLSGAGELRAQSSAAWNVNYSKLGLKSDVTGEWVIQPQFESAQSNKNGYFAFKQGYKWGVYDWQGKELLPFIYDGAAMFEHQPYIALKKEGYWGLVSVDGIEVLPFIYQSIEHYGRWLVKLWVADDAGGGKYEQSWYETARIQSLYEQKKEEIETRRIRQEKEQQLREKIARQEQQLRLASFTTYAKSYVEPRINQWQQKDEFETTAEYRLRVTGPNRAEQVEKLTAEAREAFLREHAALHPQPELRLESYDADNEVYLLRSPAFGELLLPVPRTEARTLRERFAEYRSENLQFHIAEDKAALLQFDLVPVTGEGSAYRYHAGAGLTHNTYEIAYSQFEFDPIQTSVSPSASVRPSGSGNNRSNSVPVYRKPVLSILSPHSGAEYLSPEVVVRYEALTFDGSTPQIEVFINSERYIPEPTGGKGVKRSYSEIVLQMPRQSGKNSVLIQVTDNAGMMDQQTLSLYYAGDRPLPELHILAVGVSDYLRPDLRLKQASKDARSFVSVFRGKSDLHYRSIREPQLLTDAEATQMRVKTALAQLETRVSQDDVIFLYFSGHGAQEGSDTYFLPVDADPGTLYATAIDFGEIRKIVRRLVERKCRVVLFMDACHAGAMSRTRSPFDHFVLAEPGMVGFYASTAGQRSQESDQWDNGIFTRAVVEGLQGAAADGSGVITLDGLHSFVSRYVAERTGGRQSPVYQNDLGNFTLFKTE